MEEYINTLDNYYIIKFFGGLNLVIITLIAIIWGFVNKIILNKIQRESDSKFEEIKGKINRMNTLESNFTQQFGQTFQKLYEKRIIIAEIFWINIMGTKNTIPATVHSVYRILTDKELSQVFLDKKIGLEVSKLSLTENNGKRTLNSQKIEEIRPFLTEKMWLLANAYSGFIGRSIFLLVDGYHRENIKNWKSEDGINQILSNVLSKKEIEYIIQNPFPYDTCLQLLELKMLNEINILISNNDFTDDTLKQIERINPTTNVKLA